jgi:hypothetical protein
MLFSDSLEHPDRQTLSTFKLRITLSFRKKGVAKFHQNTQKPKNRKARFSLVELLTNGSSQEKSDLAFGFLGIDNL